MGKEEVLQKLYTDDLASCAVVRRLVQMTERAQKVANDKFKEYKALKNENGGA